MEEKQSNEKQRDVYPISRKKRQSVVDIENSILYWVGRFGWVSYYQIGLLVYPNKPTLRAKGEQSRVVLERLVREGFLEKSYLGKLKPAKQKVIDQPKKKPSRRPKAYSLSKKGQSRVLFLPDWSGRNTPIYYNKIKEMQTFHRLVSNQIVIDLACGRLEFPEVYSQNWDLHLPSLFTRAFKSEVEISEKRNEYKSFFRCQPDGLWWSQEDMSDHDEDATDEPYDWLFVLEVDNSSRGTRQTSEDRYGDKIPDNYFDKNPKMTRWLSELMDIKSSNDAGPLNHYTGEYLLPYDNVVQLFVCTTLSIFRDLYRKTELAERNRYIEHAKGVLMNSPNSSDLDLSSSSVTVQLKARELRDKDSGKDLEYLIFYIVLNESNITWADPIVGSGYDVYVYGDGDARELAQEHSSTINQHHKDYVPKEK
jgi:hypothetical protein